MLVDRALNCDVPFVNEGVAGVMEVSEVVGREDEFVRCGEKTGVRLSICANDAKGGRL